MVYAVPNLRTASHGLLNTGWSVAVKSQTFTFRSAPREARCLPLGWNATLMTESECAFSMGWTTLPVLLFQILIDPSPHAEAIRSPSGLNAMPLTSVFSRRTNG